MSEWPFEAGYAGTHQGNTRPTFRLVTFGGPTLIAGTRHVALSPLRAALLGLLATAPDAGVSTTRAIDLLWRPAPSSRLRHRISQLIYSLNREFRERLVVRKHHRHCLTAAIATDYGVLLTAISDKRLAEAADLFKRGFLSELAKSPSDAFSEWLDETRFDLSARIRQAAVEQWTHLTGQGCWKRATEAARALVSLNPYDERALRMLIRAEAMSGRVGEAEAAFHSFVERSEMGNPDWVPNVETLSLVSHIHDMPTGAGARSVARPMGDPPLIGRSKELAALSAAMLPPEDGLRLVVLRGEYGIGKTRLVEEALARGPLNGVRAIRSGAPSRRHVSFLDSLVDALRSSDLEADIRQLAEPWRTIIRSLLKKPPTATAPSTEPAAAAGGRASRRCFEAVWRLLVEVARNKPTVIFIDDFQWVDSDSAAGLRYVFERWPPLPLAVTLATRTDCLRERNSVSRLLGGCLLQYEPSEFLLGELSREAAAELVDVIADGGIEPEARDRIVELSGRNPFFILELADQLGSGRRLRNLNPDDFVPVPQSIAIVFSDRLAALDDDAERALQLLSVLGRPVCVDALSALADKSHDSCVEALDRLQQSRLVGWEPRGFVTRHELIRHTVYGRMNVARRAWVHGRVAVHLDGVDTKATSAELAMHYHHARMRAHALRHALDGARIAERAGAFAGASRLLAVAREDTDDPRIHARIAARLARLHYLRRDVVDGPARLTEAALLLRGVQRLGSALVSDILRVDLLASGGSCPPREAAARIREFGRAAERQKHWKAAAKSIELELKIHRREGRSPEADRVAARAQKLLDRVQPEARGSLHTSLALHHQGDLDAGLGHARKAIIIARRMRAPDELLSALVRLVAIQGTRGLITDPEVASAVREGEALAANRDHYADHYDLLVSAGIGYRVIGHLDQARNWFAKAGAVLADVNVCDAHVALDCKLGELALEAKQLDQSAAHFDRARKRWTPGMGRYLGIISHSGAGLIALRLGRFSLARRMAVHASEPPASWFDDPWVFALFKAHLCEWRGIIVEGVDAVGDLAKVIETSQPAHGARLKFEEALLRLRHSLPRRYEIADAAEEAADNLGIDRWVRLLKAARQRARFA